MFTGHHKETMDVAAIADVEMHGDGIVVVMLGNLQAGLTREGAQHLAAELLKAAAEVEPHPVVDALEYANELRAAAFDARTDQDLWDQHRAAFEAYTTVRDAQLEASKDLG